MTKIWRFVETCENATMTFGQWLGALLLIIFACGSIKYLLATGTFALPDAYQLVYAPTLSLSLALSLIILLHFFSGTAIEKVSKVFLVPFFIYNIPLPPHRSPFEIGIMALASFGYIRLKQKNIIVSLAGGLAAAALCLAYAELPSVLIGIVKLLVFISGALRLKNFALPEGIIDGNAIIILGLFSVAILSLAWLALSNRPSCAAVLKNMRLTRSLHYLFLCAFGAFISGLHAPPADSFEGIRIAGMLAAVFFVFQFSVVTNDIFDTDCDRISNTDRPLITQALSKETYLVIGCVFLALGLLFAYGVSDTCVMIALMFTAFYFLYSAPPLRLKRFFPIGACIIGLEALLAFMAGMASLEKYDVFAVFHPSLFWLIFTVFSLSGNIKDLKDFEGDRRTGVVTLPVLLGEEKGRRVIAFLVFLSYVLVPFFLHFSFPKAPVLVLSLGFGVGNYLNVRRKNSREQSIFLTYFVYGLCLMLLIR